MQDEIYPNSIVSCSPEQPVNRAGVRSSYPSGRRRGARSPRLRIRYVALLPFHRKFDRTRARNFLGYNH